MAKPIKILLFAFAVAVLMIALYLLFMPRAPIYVTPPGDNSQNGQPETVLTQAEQDELVRQLADSQASPQPTPQAPSAGEESQLKQEMAAEQPRPITPAQRQKLMEQMSAR